MNDRSMWKNEFVLVFFLNTNLFVVGRGMAFHWFDRKGTIDLFELNDITQQAAELRHNT